jgi:hypothetical protein
MDTEDEFSLSCFLDHDAIDKFVDSLVAFHVLFFKNDDLDMRVLELQDWEVLNNTMRVLFTDVNTATHMLVSNGLNDDRCPYFRIIMQDYSMRTPVNYKLETFLRQSGILGVHARCSVAMVIGLMGNSLEAPMVDIPASYRCIPITGVDMIDLTGRDSDMREFEGKRLMGIQGMELPCDLPIEIQSHILQYLRSPCAELIHAHVDQVQAWVAYWHRHFAYLVLSPGTW